MCLWSILRPVPQPANTSELFSVPLTTTSLSWADCMSGSLLMKVGAIDSIYVKYVHLSICTAIPVVITMSVTGQHVRSTLTNLSLQHRLQKNSENKYVT